MLNWVEHDKSFTTSGPGLGGSENGLVGRLVVLGVTALWDSISVYIGPSPKEREKEERKG